MFLCVFSLFSVSNLIASEDVKSKRLSPEEAAEGWIALFDGETTFGWTIDGESSIVDGALVLGGTKETTATWTSMIGNFQMRGEVKCTGKPANLEFHSRKGDDANKTTLELRIHEEWTLRGLQRNGNNFEPASPDDKGKIAFPEVTERKVGEKRKMTLVVPAGGTFSIKNFALRPTDGKSIFNGKDMTGWKEISGKKSKFVVTDKGEINVKDGPGDLQSEGQWENFVLQIDVISNGKHLNSGVFFRANPGEFWSGYESQVRNQWQGDDRAKPVDFGTGGLYNRQPARRVVSSDNEWFTKTVIANRDHISIWINGYQTVDYYDDKPDAPSARKGRRLGKGVISLQGHDPTTDLSFRNIRISELVD